MTQPVTPDTPTAQPLPQHLEALQLANAVRHRRTYLRRAVAGRHLSLLALLTDKGLEAGDRRLIETLPIPELLSWGFRIGENVSRRIVGSCAMRPTLTLERLSAERRQELVDAVTELAPHACVGYPTLLELEASGTAEVLHTRAQRAAA